MLGFGKFNVQLLSATSSSTASSPGRPENSSKLSTRAGAGITVSRCRGCGRARMCLCWTGTLRCYVMLCFSSSIYGPVQTQNTTGVPVEHLSCFLGTASTRRTTCISLHRCLRNRCYRNIHLTKAILVGFFLSVCFFKCFTGMFSKDLCVYYQTTTGDKPDLS